MTGYTTKIDIAAQALKRFLSRTILDWRLLRYVCGVVKRTFVNRRHPDDFFPNFERGCDLYTYCEKRGATESQVHNHDCLHLVPQLRGSTLFVLKDNVLRLPHAHVHMRVRKARDIVFEDEESAYSWLWDEI